MAGENNPSYTVDARGYLWDVTLGEWVKAGAGGGTGSAVTVTNWPSTQPVSGTVSVGNFPSTQPVSGTLAVSNFPATQPVSGTVAVSSAPTTAVTGPVTDAQLRASAVPVSGAFFQATQPVSGTFWQATQPVSGTLATKEAGTHWAVNHAPAAATIATITQAAAGAGLKNVCTSLTVSLSSAAAPVVGVVTFVLRDGAAGAGAIRWTVKLSLPATAGAAAAVSLPLWIEGTANTAMTIETTAAPAANVQATVSLSGTTA